MLLRVAAAVGLLLLAGCGSSAAAPDFRRRGIHGRLAQGGGTIDCAHGKVAAWVMRGL